MTTIHVQLDDETYQRLCRKAQAEGLTPDEYLARWAKEDAAATEGAAVTAEAGNPFLGAFANDADLIDAVLDDIMQTRERPWRLPCRASCSIPTSIRR